MNLTGRKTTIKRNPFSKEGGYSFAEILVALAVFSIAYVSIAGLIYQSARGISMGKEAENAYTLARNGIKRLKTVINPLFIGLSGGDVRDVLTNPGLSAVELVGSEDDTRKEIGEGRSYPLDMTQERDELKDFSFGSVRYTRTSYKQVLSLAPPLVQIWVEVTYRREDSREGRTFSLTTLLAESQ